MAPLPHADIAILELSKLADYCLSASHPRGRHKARVFRNALGITEADAAWLRLGLLGGLPTAEAIELGTDGYGARWRADIRLARQGKRAVIRSIWLVRTGEPPRFLTCWVL
jgi:hypothetical protein